MTSTLVEMREGGIASRAKALPSKPEAVLLPYQRRWIADQSTMRIWEKSRRIGADYCEAYHVAHSRISGQRPIDYWYSSNDESAAREFMEYVAWWSGLFGRVAEIVDDTLDLGDLSVQVFRIVFNGCGARGGRATDPKAVALTSNPQGFRSKGGDVTISEYAFHKDARALWKAAIPCITWGGRFSTLSSHNGVLSVFNERVEGAKRHADPKRYGDPKPGDVRMSLHRTDIYDAVNEGLCERINAVSGRSLTREQFLEELRSNCGDPHVWEEEYECKPSSDAGSYFPYDLIRPLVSASAPKPTDNLARFLADVMIRSEGASALWAGCDIGRHHDLFALSVRAKVGGMWRLAGMLTLKRQAFPVMQGAINATMSGTFAGGLRVSRICIDKTGMGEQMAEESARKFGTRAEPVNFSPAVKAELATLARRHCEEKTINLPDDPVTLAHYNGIRRTVTVSGAVRFDGEKTKDGHSDIFWADAMALYAGDRGDTRVFNVPSSGGFYN